MSGHRGPRLHGAAGPVQARVEGIERDADMKPSIKSARAVEVALTRHLLPTVVATTAADPDVRRNPTMVLMERIAAGARADAVVLIQSPTAKNT